MDDINQVQWPKEVNQKIIDHIFGKPVPPQVAESMGLYKSANKLYTKLVLKDLNEKRTYQQAPQVGTGRVGATGAVQQSPVQASSQRMPEDGVLRSPKTLSEGVG